MAPNMCYPVQVAGPNMCQREIMLERVKNLIQDMGNRGVNDARPALCKKTAEREMAVLKYDQPVSHEADGCICNGETRQFTDYYQPVTVDGQLARPVLPYSAVYKPIKYCPPCERRKPDMVEFLGCFTKGGRRRNNLNQRRGSGDKCSGVSKCVRPDYPWGRQGYRRHSLSSGGDLGQSCPERNIHSVCTNYECPPDPSHRHWSPACTNCNFPNACYASCFEHPVYKDWVYRQPSYRFYLQKRWDKPFMPGF